jgi:hypothetical protein
VLKNEFGADPGGALHKIESNNQLLRGVAEPINEEEDYLENYTSMARRFTKKPEKLSREVANLTSIIKDCDKVYVNQKTQKNKFESFMAVNELRG